MRYIFNSGEQDQANIPRLQLSDSYNSGLGNFRQP
jgi:hypothetical protein